MAIRILDDLESNIRKYLLRESVLEKREREKGRSTKGLKIQGIGREFKKIPP